MFESYDNKYQSHIVSNFLKVSADEFHEKIATLNVPTGLKSEIYLMCMYCVATPLALLHAYSSLGDKNFDLLLDILDECFYIDLDAVFIYKDDPIFERLLYYFDYLREQDISREDHCFLLEEFIKYSYDKSYKPESDELTETRALLCQNFFAFTALGLDLSKNAINNYYRSYEEHVLGLKSAVDDEWPEFVEENDYEF